MVSWMGVGVWRVACLEGNTVKRSARSGFSCVVFHRKKQTYTLIFSQVTQQMSLNSVCTSQSILYNIV